MISIETLALIAAVSMLPPAAAGPGLSTAAQPDELKLRVTAVGAGASVTLGDVPGGLPGSDASMYADEALPVRVAGPPGEQQAALSIAAARLALVIDTLEIELQLRPDGGVRIRIPRTQAAAGWVDVVHDLDTPLALIALDGVSIGLPKGAIRIRKKSKEGELEIVVVEGRAAVEVERAAPGVEAPPVVLEAGANNRADVAADGSLGPPQREEGVGGRMSADRIALIQRSSLPELVRVAEAVAEGDIEPPTRAARLAAISVAPEVRLAEVVPRGGIAVQLAVGVQAFGAGVTQSTAEAFIGSRQAALAVVGARLQRTRIVGNPGTSRAPLAISGELTAPFQLGR